MVEKDDNYGVHETEIKEFRIPIKDNRMVVFDNLLTYHKVSQMKLSGSNGVGHRKCIIFFMIKSEEWCYTEDSDDDSDDSDDDDDDDSDYSDSDSRVEVNSRGILMDTSTVQTNLHYHMIQIVSIWFDLRNINKNEEFKEEYNYNQGYQWMFDTMTMYLIGDKYFIQTTKDLFRKSRKSHRYELFKNKQGDLIQHGFDFTRSDW